MGQETLVAARYSVISCLGVEGQGFPHRPIRLALHRLKSFYQARELKSKHAHHYPESWHTKMQISANGLSGPRKTATILLRIGQLVVQSLEPAPKKAARNV